MSDKGMPTVDELELEELGRIRDENYSDLLDQMDERWGNVSEAIGRSEINAFLESRIVHKPAARLRARIKTLEDALRPLAALDYNDTWAVIAGDPPLVGCSIRLSVIDRARKALDPSQPEEVERVPV